MWVGGTYWGECPSTQRCLINTAHLGTFDGSFRNMMWRFILIFLLFNFAKESHALRYYVDLNATGSADGLTWANAFTDLQESLSIVVPGDILWVAAGQYKPTTGNDRTISFQLRNGVTLYGGFAGNETVLAQRDIAVNLTILTGDIGEPGFREDNSHSVVTFSNSMAPTSLDGFRIVNGYSASGTSYNGGGLRVTNVFGEFVLRNCMVVNNYSGTYGGGLYLASARMKVLNCEFNNNEAGSGSGGALYNGNVNGSGSTLIIRDCRFTNNSARIGACLTNSQAYDELVIDRCTFTNNTSEYSILDIDDFNSAELLNSYVIGNTVNGFTSNVLEVNSTNSDEVFTMVNCTVAHNFNVYTNLIQSPIIRFFDSVHKVQNCIIHGNTVEDGLQISANAVISHSIVDGGHSGGTNIIDSDPLFSAPYTGAPSGFDATDHDYTLQPTSPAVNVGLNSAVVAPYDLDLTGLPRIQGGVVDLGCYETDQTVGLREQGPSGDWYFDVTRGELHLTSAQPTRNQPITIHDMNGRLIASLIARAAVVRIDLPSGTFIATAPELGTLRMIVR